jgi:hypothetical protein
MPTSDQIRKARGKIPADEVQTAIDEAEKNKPGLDPSEAASLKANATNDPTQAALNKSLTNPENVTAIPVKQSVIPIIPDTQMVPTDQFAGIPQGPMNAAMVNPPARVLAGDVIGTLPPPTPAHAIVPPVTKSVGPVVAKAAPTTKEMIASLLKHTGPEGELVMPSETSSKAKSDFNFADLLKGAGSKLGEFLQTWGLAGLGQPITNTNAAIQRAQEFEIKKQQAAAQIQAAQAALENKYQMERMNLQNQMNVANIPIEAKANLQKQMAVLDAQFQNEMKLLPMKIQQERAIRGMAAGADPGAHFVGGP